MNEYYIQFNGKANIPDPLEIGHNFTITSDCSIVSENRSDNDDGTLNITFKAKPVTVEIKKDNGEVVKAKDKRSISKLFRNLCWKEHANKYPLLDFDLVYEKVGYKAMSLIPQLMRDVAEELENKDEE